MRFLAEIFVVLKRNLLNVDFRNNIKLSDISDFLRHILINTIPLTFFKFKKHQKYLYENYNKVIHHKIVFNKKGILTLKSLV